MDMIVERSGAMRSIHVRVWLGNPHHRFWWFIAQCAVRPDVLIMPAPRETGEALDNIRNPQPKQPQDVLNTPTQNTSSKATPLSDAERQKIQKRIAELQAEETALLNLNRARSQEDAALKQAMIVNEQDQA